MGDFYIDELLYFIVIAVIFLDVVFRGRKYYAFMNEIILFSGFTRWNPGELLLSWFRDSSWPTTRARGWTFEGVPDFWGCFGKYTKHWYRNKKYNLSQPCWITWYTELLFGHLTYSLRKNVLNQFPNNLQNVKKAQNKIIRAIFRLPKFDRTTQKFTEISPLYKKLGVLKLWYIIWFHISTNCYEYFNNKEFPTKSKDKFCKKCDMSTWITRTEKSDLYYKPPNLLSSNKQPSICGSAFWNSLSSEIRESTSITTFKNGLEQYFLEKAN